jgi:hypothetical protein
MQVENATDLVFRSHVVLKPLYEQLSRQAILTVKAEHVATFLGHKITSQLAQEIGSRFTTRIEGTCVKHRFGKSSIKIYDKFGLVLRIETTTNDVSAFKHYRKVEHQQGPASYTLAPVKKNIYSLTALAHILLGCNRRYLEYLSSLDDFSAGIRALDRLTQPRPVKGRTIRGLNFFSRAEQTLLSALQRPAFNIAGLRRADLRPFLAQCSPATLTRYLARLRQLGVIKRVTGTYRYYLTRAGRGAVALAAASLNTASFPPSPNKLCSLLAVDRVALGLATGVLTRISHRGRCIGAPFLRKSCLLNGLSQDQRESRCRQSVARRYSNLHASKGARWWARLMAVRSPRMPVPFCWRRRTVRSG